MEPQTSRSADGGPVVATIFTVLLHAGIPAAVWVFIMFKLPEYQRMMEEMQVALPTIAKMTMSFGAFVRNHLVLYPIGLGLFLAADGAAYYCIWRFLGRGFAKAWSVLVVLAEVAAAGLMSFSIYLVIREVLQSVQGGG